MATVGIAMLVGALLFFATTIAYTWGAYRAVCEQDDYLQTATLVAEYGALLRLEAKALGVPVEELIERDARLARGEAP